VNSRVDSLPMIGDFALPYLLNEFFNTEEDRK
jgi:hypothetical protein